MEWWTVEVLDVAGPPATSWQASYGQVLVEVAVTQRVQAWDWVVRPWGVVLELAFLDESDWLRFRAVPRSGPPWTPSPTRCTGCWSTRVAAAAAQRACPAGPRPAPLQGGAVAPAARAGSRAARGVARAPVRPAVRPGLTGIADAG